MSKRLHGSKAQPLKGKRVLLTRADDGLSLMDSTLCKAGADVVSMPLTTIRPVETPLMLKSAPDWLFFTSRQGIVHSLSRLKKTGWLNNTPVAVVGASTAQFAREAGLKVAFCPEPPYHAESALAQFTHQVEAAGRRLSILWPCSALAGEALGKGLIAHELCQWPVYVSVPSQALSEPQIATLLEEGKPFNWVVLTSPTAAIVWARLCPSHSRQVPLISMGPKTTMALAKHWPQAMVREAVVATPEGVVEAMS